MGFELAGRGTVLLFEMGAAAKLDAPGGGARTAESKPVVAAIPVLFEGELLLTEEDKSRVVGALELATLAPRISDAEFISFEGDRHRTIRPCEPGVLAGRML